MSRVDRPVVLVGPIPPFKGGIAHHTARLAEEMAQRSVDVAVETWAAQYPERLYPGEQFVPDPDGVRPLSVPVRRRLRWFDPLSWVRVGWQARRADVVIVTLVIPFQVIPFLVLSLASRCSRRRPRLVVIAHNVVPHERRPGDAWLVARLVRRADWVVVHGDDERARAASLRARSVRAAALPPHLPVAESVDRRGDPPTSTLLFFGLIRPYKGLDDLLDALVDLPDERLLVCGELWGERDDFDAGVRQRGLDGRVELRAGYVDDRDIPAVFAECDALVLPYRSGTGSQNVLLGHRLGVPVIATDVAGFGSQIDDGITGFVCQPDDVDDLAEAVRSLRAPGVLERLRSNIAELAGSSTAWDGYVTTLLGQPDEN